MTLLDTAPPPAAAPPRLRRARRAVAATFLLNGAAFGAWVGRIPDVAEQRGLSEAVLGATLLAMAVGALTGMQLVTPVVRRVGRRRLVAVSAVAYVLLLVPLAVAPGRAVGLAAALFVLGVSTGLLDVAMNAAAVDVERQYRRPVMSSFHAVFSVGGLIGAGTAGLLAGQGVPVVAGFAGTAAVLVVLALATARDLPEDPPPQVSTATGAAPPLALGPVVVLGVVAFLCLMAEGSAADWSALYLREDRGAGPTLAVAGFVAFSALMTLGRTVGDRVTARLGAQRTVRAGAGFAGVGILLAVGSPVTALSVVGFGLQGAGLSVLVPVVFSAAGRLPGDAERSLARVSSIGYLGFLAGPPLIGGLAHLVGLGAALALPAVLLLLVAARARVPEA